MRMRKNANEGIAPFILVALGARAFRPLLVWIFH